jgi:hypothetical protein
LCKFFVNLRTFIGKPIEYDENRTAEELKELVIFTFIYLKQDLYKIVLFYSKTKQRIEELINEHQRLPGSIFQALLDRFRTFKKKSN